MIDPVDVEARRRRYGIVFINAGSLFAQIVQAAGYPTLLALLLVQMGLPSWLMGAILSLQWAVVLFLAPLVPKAMNRFGARASSMSGAFLSSLALLLLLAPASLPVVTISAFLMGVGLTIRWVGCDTWIVETVAGHLRGRSISVHETLMGLGIAAGPLLTLASAGNAANAVAAFIALLVLSFLCFGFGPRSSAEHHQGSRNMNPVRLVFGMVTLALVAALAAGYIETAMVSLLPLYLMSFQYPEAQALFILSVFGLGGTILQIPLGWLADRWGFRAAQSLCLLLILVGGPCLILMISTDWVVLIILFAWGGCAGGLNTLAVIEAGSTLPVGLAGTGMALVASSYTFGGVIGPALSGATLELGGGHGAIIVIIGLMAIYGVLLVVSRQQRIRRT